MKYLYCGLLIMISSVTAFAQPAFSPTSFLNYSPPQRMCQDYIDEVDGPMSIALLQPTGGALVSVDMGNRAFCMYIFCDQPLNRLMIFSLFEDSVGRAPNEVKVYGQYLPDVWFTVAYQDSSEIPDTLSPPQPNYDSIGCFYGPVDVAVSSCNRYFNPSVDRVYVLDQGNRRVVVLQYDAVNDTLLWSGEFGQDYLIFPTSLDYADYGDTAVLNDDIYVTDGAAAKVYRFSRAGDYEAEYGGYGSSMALIGYPTGIAVATDPSLPDRFYISDSKNHRVAMYHSGTEGPIVAEWQYRFPHYYLSPYDIPYLSAIDTDNNGSVYVVDKFHHDISILSSDLRTHIKDYGEYGLNPGQFNYPVDIYIDSRDVANEIQVCESWDSLSGIQSLVSTYSQAKRIANAELPRQFELYQNYPNPFNSVTTISFDLPAPGYVDLDIYNILGQKVMNLVSDFLPAGHHVLIWDGKNNSDDEVATGIYLYMIKAPHHQATKKLLLLK